MCLINWGLYTLLLCTAWIAVADVAVWSVFSLRNQLDPGGGDERYKLPNYRGVPWAAQHFKEWHGLRSEYRGFIGWRRKDFKGQTITIEDGIRRSLGHALNGSVWFLGGSAIWGTGVNDATTIPSLFHQSTSHRVLNLGEGAYTSRQSLDLLLNMLSEGYTPKALVSYEGANEVSVHCLKWVNRLPVHYMEDSFRAVWRKERLQYILEWSEEFIWYVPQRVKSILAPVEDTSEIMDCHSSGEKARRVAQNLIDNWKFMNTIAKQRHIPFYAVLQPTIFTARSRVDHLPQKEFVMRQEYLAVYPLVQQLASEQCRHGECGIVADVSDCDFGDHYVFIDYVHLSPSGNELVAKRLARLVGVSQA